MSTTQELERTLTELSAARRGDTDLARLSRFYEHMKQLGMVVKKEYDLPPLDTIGRTAYLDR